jgi:hypothetical protein
MADYNINAVTRRVVFTGSAGLGPYAFTFEVLNSDDVAVYFNATLLTITTDYTVTINANGTGSVTIVTGGSVPSTPTASDQIVIVGARDIERVTDFVTAGDLLASSLNEQLDALTIFDQQVAEEQKRSLQAPVYDPAHVDDGGTLDMTLPAKATRAGKYLSFNTDGNPIAASGTTDTPVNAAMDTFVGSATLAAARTELLTGTNLALTANTVSSSNSNGDINLSPNGTGTVIINTDLDVDNININGNTISSTDTNGNINLSPNGTGEVVIDAINISSNVISGTTINGDIKIEPNGSGILQLPNGALGITNGGTPGASLTSGVLLFAEDVSSSSELKVRDEAGNVTTLSPHNFDLIPAGASEDLAWSYYSQRDGKTINVDMLKALRVLEQISGEKLVYIEE